MTKMIVLVALLAAAGCSKKGSDCDASISKGMNNFISAIKTREPNPQRQETLLNVVGKLKTTLTQRCNEDTWAPEAVTCFTTVSSQPEVRACEDKLTKEQHTKLTKELMQIMMESRMPSGVAGHPPMLAGSGDPGAGGPGGSVTVPAGSAAPAGSATAPTGSAVAPTGSAPAPAGSAPAPAGSAPAPAGSAAPAATGW